MRKDRFISRFGIPRMAWILGVIPMFGLLVAGGLEAAQPSWSAPTGLPYSMYVYFTLTDSSGNSLSATNSELAVFNGSNVAGVAQLSDGPRGPIFQVVVYSATPTITGLTLQLYNGATDGIWTLTNTINFQSGRTTGNGSLVNPATAVAAPQSQTIIFPEMGSINYSTGLTTNLGATASSGLAVSYSTANTNLISISSNVAAVLGTGTATIVANQSGNSNYLTAPPVTNTLVIGKGTASVSFSGTNETYDGTIKSVMASTVPTNLSVGVTYNGSSNAPSNAGSYSVVGVVNDQNYTGSNSTTLTIAKATPPAFTFLSNSLNTLFTGSNVAVRLTNTASVPLNITYNGSSNLPSTAGTYTVVAMVADTNNYSPYSVTNTLVISNAATPTNVSIIYEQGWTDWIGPKEKR